MCTWCETDSVEPADMAACVSPLPAVTCFCFAFSSSSSSSPSHTHSLGHNTETIGCVLGSRSAGRDQRSIAWPQSQHPVLGGFHGRACGSPGCYAFASVPAKVCACVFVEKSALIYSSPSAYMHDVWCSFWLKATNMLAKTRLRVSNGRHQEKA